MTPRSRKIWIATGITLMAGTVATVAIMRQRKKKEMELLSDFINNKLKRDNDKQRQAEEDTKKTLYDMAKKYPGDPKKYLKFAPNTRIGDVIVGFHKSMDGVGTDMSEFTEQLYKIKNLYTWQFIDETYRKMYGARLISDIKGELKLYGKAFDPNPWVNQNPTALFLLGGANFNPGFANYIAKLPEV